MVAEAVHSPTRRDVDAPILTAVVERSSHPTTTDVNAPAQNSMPASSSFIDHAEMASRLIFGFDLRPIQRHVLSQIFDPANPRKRLIVQPTAIGKSHIIRMMGVLFKGIHLILHPLLAFTGDQVTKKLSFRLLESFEAKLNKEGIDDLDKMHIHGSLPKEHKFHLVNIFLPEGCC